MNNHFHLLAQDGKTEWAQVYNRDEMVEIFGTLMMRKLAEGESVVLRQHGSNIIYTDMMVAARYVASLNTVEAK